MAKAKKAISLRQVPDKDFQVMWDPKRNSCIFHHRSGKGGELGCGVTDAVAVFSGGNRVFVLSVNYPKRYACLEAFKDEHGVDELILAEPGDINKMFGDEFASYSPKKIAQKLADKL